MIPALTLAVATTLGAPAPDSQAIAASIIDEAVRAAATYTCEAIAGGIVTGVERFDLTSFEATAALALAGDRDAGAVASLGVAYVFKGCAE